MKDIPPCTRCGQCCKEATVCDLRGWVSADRNPHFTGTCDQLVMSEDGVATCKAIQSVFENPDIWHPATREFITKRFIGRGCEKFIYGDSDYKEC